MFLTLSANETQGPQVLRILHRLSDEFDSLGCDVPEDEIFQKLDRFQRAHLVAEGAVTCAIYFNEFVRIILKLLRAKKSYNPVGKYHVKDHFEIMHYRKHDYNSQSSHYLQKHQALAGINDGRFPAKTTVVS